MNPYDFLKPKPFIINDRKDKPSIEEIRKEVELMKKTLIKENEEKERQEREMKIQREEQERQNQIERQNIEIKRREEEKKREEERIRMLEQRRQDAIRIEMERKRREEEKEIERREKELEEENKRLERKAKEIEANERRKRREQAELDRLRDEMIKKKEEEEQMKKIEEEQRRQEQEQRRREQERRRMVITNSDASIDRFNPNSTNRSQGIQEVLNVLRKGGKQVKRKREMEEDEDDENGFNETIRLERETIREGLTDENIDKHLRFIDDQYQEVSNDDEGMRLALKKKVLNQEKVESEIKKYQNLLFYVPPKSLIEKLRFKFPESTPHDVIYASVVFDKEYLLSMKNEITREIEHIYKFLRPWGKNLFDIQKLERGADKVSGVANDKFYKFEAWGLEVNVRKKEVIVKSEGRELNPETFEDGFLRELAMKKLKEKAKLIYVKYLEKKFKEENQ